MSADDSDDESLVSLIETSIENSGVGRWVSDLECSHCGNNEPDQLTFSSLDVNEQLVVFKCNLCQQTSVRGYDADVDESGYCSGEDVFASSTGGAVDRDYVEAFRHVECTHCGNDDPELFQKFVDSDSGKLLSVRCFQCDVTESFDKPPSYIQCSHCDNSDRDLFDIDYTGDGEISTIHCQVCLKTLKMPRRCVPESRPTVDHGAWTPYGMQTSCRSLEHSENRTRIHSLCDVKPGDHIAFLRVVAQIWHHAIVVSTEPHSNEATLIHYTGAPTKVDGHFASVRLEAVKINPDKERVYRYEYKGRCFDPEEVVDRAFQRLGEVKYNILTNNCEHFARWCKVGDEKCLQSDAVKSRLPFAGVSSLLKPIEEGIMGGIRYFLFDEIPAEIFKVGTKGLSYGKTIVQRAGDIFTKGMTKVGSGMKIGSLFGCLGLNFAIEGINFGIQAWNRYRMKRDKKITDAQFRRELAKTGCECAGGAIGATLGGLLLQVLIPIPIIGSLVGGVVGNILGRLFGRQIYDASSSG